MIYINDLKFFQPEIFLFFSLIAILVTGIYVFFEIKKINEVRELALLSLIITFIMLIYFPSQNFSCFFQQVHFNFFFLMLKQLLVIVTFIVTLVSKSYFINQLKSFFEFYILVHSSLLSIFFIICSSDFLILYLSLELQALSFYILASFKKHSIYSVEAGLKYFVLGSSSSIFFLFGVTFVYIFTGTTNIYDFLLFHSVKTNQISFIILVGFIFILGGLVFKLPAAPFHVWAPDVYEGSPLITTMCFALIPKIAIFGFLFSFFYFFCLPFLTYWSFILIMLGIFSIVIGSFGAMYQIQIKRFVAYSAVVHTGFMLISLSTGMFEGIEAALFYLFIYIIITLSLFMILVVVRRVYGYSLKNLSDFLYLYKSYPIIAVIASVNFFSMAGIPPFAGFFSKLYVLLALTKSEIYFITIIVLVFSIFSCVYYVRFVKTIFFHKHIQWKNIIAISYENSVILIGTFFLIFFLFFLSKIFIQTYLTF